MTQLRLEQYVMPAANLGPNSPLVPFVLDTAELVVKRDPGEGVSPEEVQYVGYGYHDGCLPYLVQDGYDRDVRPRPFRVAVLENEILRATFLLDLGGRLWSLHHKPTGRELIHLNPVFQPGNLGIRNAWFSGGVEWNFCWIGHTPFTCDRIWAARVQADDGSPVLRMWEYERVRQMPFQIDAHLPPGSGVLYIRVRLANLDQRTVPVYWWSNIAVPEQADARVVVPTTHSYGFNWQTRKLGLVSYPVPTDVDMSYTTNAPHSGDRFFKLPQGQYPWIAWVEGNGEGFFHASTSRLTGRKLWVFGQHAGGRKWQDFLNTPGHPYIEIQGGLGKTQLECLPLPAKTEWEWLEAYGSVQADPKVVHGRDWPAAWQETQRQIDAQVSHEQIERLLVQTRPMAQRPPQEIIHQASGWGALETLRRQRSGQGSFHDPALAFPEDSIGDEQAPWLELLQTGRFGEADPRPPPASYMIQDEWRWMLEQSVRDGRSDNWAAWMHLGIMYVAQKQFEPARRAWERSLALRKSAWAYRHLAALATMQTRHRDAAELYGEAVALAPNHTRLVQECGAAIVNAGQPERWLQIVETIDPVSRANGHIALLEVKAALAVDDLDRAGEILNRELMLTNIREGDAVPAVLWFTYHEKRIARQEGVGIDEALQQRVRKEFPPPAHLDYRLSS